MAKDGEGVALLQPVSRSRHVCSSQHLDQVADTVIEAEISSTIFHDCYKCAANRCSPGLLLRLRGGSVPLGPPLYTPRPPPNQGTPGQGKKKTETTGQ